MAATITIQHEVGDPPDNRDGSKFVVEAGGWTHSGDDIHAAINAAWDLSRNVETTVTVWDFRDPDTNDYSEVDPQPIFAVGATYIGD